MNPTALGTRRWRRFFVGGLCATMIALIPRATLAATPVFPPEKLTAPFVGAKPDGTSAITVDGVRDAAYPAAAAVVDNAKNAAANADVATTTSATLRSVWDGRTLYLLVEVSDNTPSLNDALPAWGASNATNFDGVEFALDFWNDKVDKFEDDDGLFTISRDGKLTYAPNTFVVNHQSVHAFKDGREYTNRIKDFKVASTAAGYVVELALQIHGAKLENGTSFGIDVMVGDSPATGAARSARVYWSHNDNSYPASSQDHPVDWGIVTLGGWNRFAPFAFNNWHLTDRIRWAESKSLVKGVWTAASDAELQAALANGRATLASVGAATGAGAQVAVDLAAARLTSAIKRLRWVDRKYPDPMDLPSQFTLPNPWRFFNGRPVESPDEWWGAKGRRAELLDLAQFYEYGYKPVKPDALSVTGVREIPANPGWFIPGFGWIIPPSPAHPAIDVSITYGGVTAPMSFELFLPTAEQLAASGHAGGPVPVVLSFGGFIAEYAAAGFAVLGVPTSVTTDDRNNPWGPRAGTFRTFFPYARDGDPREISNEMGAAWGASRAIDALELVVANHTPLLSLGAADTLVAADKLAVTGFSINGKYAFVSGVFDDRIDVTMPSAAGATGPAPYRYISMGHQYSWGESTGTEVMGDTIRHNPGRTTELFRRFLEPGRFYLRKPGAWGYGDRLPFDQNDLVATLAPRALVLNHTIDDYGDDSEGDALSLTVAKFTYNWLGYDGDDLLKFNFRATGGHGEDAGHRARAAAYLDYYFYGTPLSEEVAVHLNTNPFLADGAYDRYFGGLKTIAPWMHSRDIAMDVTIVPKTIPEWMSATIYVAVTGKNLKGRTLTARLMAGETTIAEAPVTPVFGAWSGVWLGSIELAQAPAAGSYKIVVKVANQEAAAEELLTVTAVAPIAITGVTVGNRQAQLAFAIESGNGRGYVLYLSETGEPGSFDVWKNVSFNSKGAQIKGLKNGQTYHVFVASIRHGYVVARTPVAIVKLD